MSREPRECRKSNRTKSALDAFRAAQTKECGWQIGESIRLELDLAMNHSLALHFINFVLLLQELNSIKEKVNGKI